MNQQRFYRFPKPKIYALRKGVDFMNFWRSLCAILFPQSQIMPEPEQEFVPFVGSDEDPYRGFELDDTPETTDVSTAVSAAIKVDPEKWHEEMAQLFDPE